MTANNRTHIRGFIYTKGRPNHENIKISARYGVICKGKKENIKRGEIVLVVSKDKNTKTYCAMVARALGTTSPLHHKNFWPDWESSKTLDVHNVQVLTRPFYISKSMFPKICTRSNIHKDVKPHLLSHILNCERSMQTESRFGAANQ